MAIEWYNKVITLNPAAGDKKTQYRIENCIGHAHFLLEGPDLALEAYMPGPLEVQTGVQPSQGGYWGGLGMAVGRCCLLMQMPVCALSAFPM